MSGKPNVSYLAQVPGGPTSNPGGLSVQGGQELARRRSSLLLARRFEPDRARPSRSSRQPQVGSCPLVPGPGHCRPRVTRFVLDTECQLKPSPSGCPGMQWPPLGRSVREGPCPRLYKQAPRPAWDFWPTWTRVAMPVRVRSQGRRPDSQLRL